MSSPPSAAERLLRIRRRRSRSLSVRASIFPISRLPPTHNRFPALHRPRRNVLQFSVPPVSCQLFDLASGYNFFSLRPLVAATLKAPTQKAYLVAFTRFAAAVDIYPRTNMEIDSLVANYIENCYTSNPAPGNRQEMSNLLSFLALAFPSIRTSLRTAHRSIKGWKLRVPPCPALPLTRDVMQAFVHDLVHRGEMAAGIALAVQWSCYLRASEVLGLSRDDIALPGDLRIRQFGMDIAAVAITDSKTGPLQFTTIRNSEIIILLRAYMAQEDSCSLVFNISYTKYFGLLKACATRFGLQGNFSTHSARIGGAVHDYGLGVSAETIAATGRWASLQSLQYYLRNGRSWIMNMPLSDASSVNIRREAAAFQSLVASCSNFVLRQV